MTKAKAAVKKFANGTSLHGASRIIMAKSTKKSVFWLLVFTFATAMFIFQVSLLLHKYFSFEKRINFEIKANNATYPWITICDQETFDPLVLENIFERFSHNKSDRHSIFERMLAEEDNLFVQSITEFYDRLKDNITDMNFWNPLIVQNFNSTVIESGVRAQQHFIVQHYGPVTFSRRIYYVNGYPKQCLTIHYDIEEYRAYYSMVSSRLFFRVFIIDYGYPDTLTRDNVDKRIDEVFRRNLNHAGVKVFVHPPNTEPPFEAFDKYIRVQPGHRGHVFMSVRNIERLEQPYGHCIREYPFKHHPPGPYVKASCYEMCMFNTIIDVCGCKYGQFAHFIDYYTNYDRSLFDVPFCNALLEYGSMSPAINASLLLEKYERRMNCVQETWKEKNTDRCTQLCPRACSEVFYDIDLHIEKSPIDYLQHAAKNYTQSLQQANATRRLALLRHRSEEGMSPKFTNVNMSEASADDDLFDAVVGRLYYLVFQLRHSDVQETSEVPEYAMSQLVSDIGGQLGLWVGMSVITLLEVVELLANLLKLTCTKKRTYEVCLEAQKQRSVHSHLSELNCMTLIRAKTLSSSHDSP